MFVCSTCDMDIANCNYFLLGTDVQEETIDSSCSLSLNCWHRSKEEPTITKTGVDVTHRMALLLLFAIHNPWCHAGKVCNEPKVCGSHGQPDTFIMASCIKSEILTTPIRRKTILIMWSQHGMTLGISLNKGHSSCRYTWDLHHRMQHES